jgi:hypothetical protein
MASGKKSFLLYCDIRSMVSKLPKEKQGELFMMILDYVNDLNPITDDLLLEIAFDPIKNQLKRDLKTYENIVDRNRENGRLGGRPQKPKKPSGLIENPTKPKKADNDNDTDKDIINKDSHNEIFRKLWTSGQWIESLCIKWKCEKTDLLNHLNDFRQECIDKDEFKIDEKDAKTHFINWVKRDNPVKAIKKNKGSLLINNGFE